VIWAELLEKLVPVLSGISIALLAWLHGSKVAKLEIKAEALQKEADLKEQADEADRRLTADNGSLQNSPPPSPDNAGPVQRSNVITFHAPLDFDPKRPHIWDDTEDNFLDTPETVERILLHNARYRALCGS
jgi:hypothetical protein